jgi:hypothetical protein
MGRSLSAEETAEEGLDGGHQVAGIVGHGLNDLFGGMASQEESNLLDNAAADRWTARVRRRPAGFPFAKASKQRTQSDGFKFGHCGANRNRRRLALNSRKLPAAPVAHTQVRLDGSP